MKKLILMTGVFMVLSSGTLLAADVEAGKASYTTCVACHGDNGQGNQALNSPSIAGQESWYLERQLKNFKAGIRGSHPDDVHGKTMMAMAGTLADDKAIANVSAYISAMSPVDIAPTLEGGDVAKGQSLYATCVACHGDQAQGNLALNAPKLSGLPDWYLVRQLENFKKGIRGKDPKDTYGMQMAPMAETLADEQAMKDVVAYILSLN